MLQSSGRGDDRSEGHEGSVCGDDHVEPTCERLGSRRGPQHVQVIPPHAVHADVPVGKGSVPVTILVQSVQLAFAKLETQS